MIVMKSEPLISVIVPIYNVKQYICKCIESIINQKYKNLQIILVDDGSTDGCGGICDSYADRDSRIKVIHKENGGLVSARKAGLSIADGDYIGFVDGDDYVEQDMYFELCSNLRESGADFISSGFKKNYGDDIYFADVSFSCCMDKQNAAEFYRRHVFDPTDEEYILTCIWSKLFKRDIIIKSYMDLPEFQSYGEDLICLCGCVFYSEKIQVIDRAYYHYTIRENSLFHQTNVNALLNECDLYRQLCNLFEKLNVGWEVKESLKDRFIREALNCISKITYINYPTYKFPNVNELCNKNVVIYGAGKVGQDYYSQICKYESCRITAWVDINPKNFSFEYCKVSSIDELKTRFFDVVIIAVLSERIAASIETTLINKGINKNKIVWCKPKLII